MADDGIVAAGRMRRFFHVVPRRVLQPGNSSRRTQHAWRARSVNCASRLSRNMRVQGPESLSPGQTCVNRAGRGPNSRSPDKCGLHRQTSHIEARNRICQKNPPALPRRPQEGGRPPLAARTARASNSGRCRSSVGSSCSNRASLRQQIPAIRVSRTEASAASPRGSQAPEFGRNAQDQTRNRSPAPLDHESGSGLHPCVFVQFHYM